MSNTRQILAMLNSRAEGDDELFFAIALQVAAAEARKGHRDTAESLRNAVNKARSKQVSKQNVPIPFAAARGDLADLLEVRNPRVGLGDVILSDTIRQQLEDFIRQQQKRDWLREHGKTPNKRGLFVGPPGSGKTMTAEGLAKSLRLPLYVIRFDSLITRFMGETAAKLRLVFDELSRKRGVYLFDEFDAVGSNRGATNDVAEMRRVLNSFLQFMEEPNTTDSVIIGATNYPDLLDRALLRRFDVVMEFGAPTDNQIKDIIKSNLRPMKYPRLAWKKIVESARDLSQSEIARASEDAVKTAILDQRDRLTTEDLETRLLERQRMRSAFDGISAST